QCVNNETGVVQTEISEIVKKARAAGARVHVDAAQAWGKIAFDVQALGASYVTFSGHKIGAPAGIGVVWVGRGSPLEPLLRGKQEKGRRGGTENVLGIWLTGEAAQAVGTLLEKSDEIRLEREKLEREVLAAIPGASVNGAGARLRVAGTSSFSFGPDVSGESLVLGLDMEGYSVSAGAACSSGVLGPSRVLLAMGRGRAEALAAMRVSWNQPMSQETLAGFVQALVRVVARIRGVAAAEAALPAGLRRVDESSPKKTGTRNV
ncbi:MAG: aminotransferase class V-fold PLP-dependent enzyme, partial [Bdellovibrionota bacterium]